MLPHAEVPHGGYGEPPCRLPELLRRKEHTYGGIACPVCPGSMGFSQKHQKAQPGSAGILQPGGACLGEDWGARGGVGGLAGKAQPQVDSGGQEAIF